MGDRGNLKPVDTRSAGLIKGLLEGLILGDLLDVSLDLMLAHRAVVVTVAVANRIRALVGDAPISVSGRIIILSVFYLILSKLCR